jgi:hypothetical protein
VIWLHLKYTEINSFVFNYLHFKAHTQVYDIHILKSLLAIHFLNLTIIIIKLHSQHIFLETDMVTFEIYRNKFIFLNYLHFKAHTQVYDIPILNCADAKYRLTEETIRIVYDINFDT